MGRVLVVEDSREYQIVVTASLEADGWIVEVVETLAQARTSLAHSMPDLVVLDLGLPDGNGLELCREIAAMNGCGVVILTGKDDESDLLLGFGAGADDYLRKPFSPAELRARVSAVGRRTRGEQVRARFGAFVTECFEIDAETMLVRVAGVVVHMTRAEYSLLHTLTERPEVVHRRAQLLQSIDGGDWSAVSDHALTVHIANLRQKLVGCAAGHIETVRGVGYRFRLSCELS